MAATLFYLDPLPTRVGDTAVLDGPEGHHAATVRRTQVGEKLALADGRGAVAHCTVTSVGKDRLEASVDALGAVPPLAPEVTVVQALPKSERSDLAVDLMVEAGADAVIPWQASRCVARWDGLKAAKGVDRWQKVATAAAKQSRSPRVPEVAPLHTTKQVAAELRRAVAEGAVALVLHEAASVPLTSVNLASARQVYLIVGPEGGVAENEVDTFREAGAVAVRLGPNVLRTSTAAAVALGALGVLTQRWDTAPLS